MYVVRWNVLRHSKTGCLYAAISCWNRFSGVCSKLIVRTVGNAVGRVPVNYVVHVYMVFSQLYIQISASRSIWSIWSCIVRLVCCWVRSCRKIVLYNSHDFERWLPFRLSKFNNSSFQNYANPVDHSQKTTDTPGLTPFTRSILIIKKYRIPQNQTPGFYKLSS